MTRRLITIVTLGMLVLGLMAGPAAATHVHGKVLANGACVLLAPSGGENEVQLPNTDDFGETRSHPLHVNVHLGVPGTEAQPGTIFVAIGDDGEYTADAKDLCGGQFVNAP
ncbi:hypothetical protein BH23ACT10_BH23ACT10_29500 [soil metagenome]